MAELQAGIRRENSAIAESNGFRVSDFSNESSDELGSSSSGGLNLSPLLRTLQRKALLVLGTTGIAAALGSQLYKAPEPVYIGNFQIQVEPANATEQLNDPRELTRPDGAPTDKLDYPTQLEILKSTVLLNDIVEEVRNTKDSKGTLLYPDFSLTKLQKGLLVEQLVGENRRFDATKIIQASYQASDSELVQAVLDATRDRYLTYSLEERTTGIDEAIRFIDSQLPELRKKVGNHQAEIQQLQQKYELINPQIQGEQLYAQISTIDTQILDTQRELPELQSQYVTLRSQLNLNPDEALAASALSESPTLAQLRTQITEVDSKLAEQSTIFQPDTPEIQQLLEQKQNLENLLNQETQRTLESSSVPVQNPAIYSFQNSTRQQLITQLVDTGNKIQVLEVRIENLRQLKGNLEQQAQEYPVIARRYNDAQKQLDGTNQLLDQFLTQREKLRVERAQDNEPWKVINQPQIETDAQGEAVSVADDKSLITMLMSTAGGLVLGVGLALLLEKLQNIFYTTEDLKESISLPLLGIIPRHKQSRISNLFKLPGLDLDSELSIPRQSEFDDAFDSLYANIRFQYPEFPLRSLAVCSAESGDGKSTVALHLAETVAGMGQKVLLIDANLRDPKLHINLGLPNQKGLSDLLTDSKLDPKIMIQPVSGIDNLFVLTAGNPSSSAIKLLGSSQMLRIVEELQNTFDLVLCDTPELQHYTDAAFLSGHLDGLLMVVSIAKSRKTVVEQTIAEVNKFHLPCLGMVGNYPRRNSAASVPSGY
ncbi:MAG: GumC family protein [Microcoleaceae cyanobacterium]